MKSIPLLIVLPGFAGALSASADILAYEGFDYAAGQVATGLNGGTGFSSGWMAANGTASQGYICGARYSSMLTLAQEDKREYCGIICCNKGKYIISKPHIGAARSYVIEFGIKRYTGGPPRCTPQITITHQIVKCPTDEWTLVADYHSHPSMPGNERFSTGDYEHVNRSNGIPFYVGTPSGKVKRLDPDPTKKDKDLPWHEGKDIPDSWGFEEKWSKNNW